MMISSIRPSRRQIIYGCLATFSTVLALKSWIWPRWPVAASLNAQAVGQQLISNGFMAEELPPLAPRRQYEWATSAGIGFRIAPGQTLRLVRGQTRERFSMSASLLATADPSLRLQKRRILNGPLSQSAEGWNAGASLRQTCVVFNNDNRPNYAVVGDDLVALIDQRGTTRADRLRSLIGLQPPRSYECILISVRSASADSAPLDEQRWQRLLNALAPALRQ
jgi:hypothetical protein